MKNMSGEEKKNTTVAKEAYHHMEAQNLFPEHLHLLFLASGMIIPTSSGMPNIQETAENSSLQ